MIDLKGRKRVAPILKPIAALLAKLRISPAMVTIVGLAITLVGAGFLTQGMLIAGASVAAFGVLLDALDGPLARHLGTTSDRGAFLDTMSDRFGEVAVWVGVAVYVGDNQRLLVLCVVSLAFSLLTPYVRAKAEMLGLEGKGGWMGRAERMILILTGIGVVGFGAPILEPLLWTFVALTGFTVFQRIWKTWQQIET